MQNKKKPDLLEYDRPGLERLMETIGRRAFHGRQLHAWIHRKSLFDFSMMTDLPKDLRRELDAHFSVHLPVVVEEVTGTGPLTATKFLFELEDRARVEAVYIPGEERKTVCLSSQVGCAFKCRFCATGSLGMVRNMTAVEMLGCFLTIQRQVAVRITNVVFMGMGEPLTNLGAVMTCWNRLTDPLGIGISKRKVTVSTIGLPRRIRALAEEPYPPKLVFSIGSPHEERRRSLLPIAGKFSLRENHEALVYYSRHTRNRITVALLIADGLNDTRADAAALHGWLGDLPAKVNLLRYNEAVSGFRPADEAKVESVAAELVRLGRTVILRQSRGRDVAAACGQLAARQVLQT